MTGLLIAQGLRKAFVPFVIVEQEPPGGRSYAREWSMSLHWGYPLFAELLTDDLLSKFKSTQTDPFNDTPEEDELPMMHAQTGEKITSLPLGLNYRVSRDKLRMLCAQGIDVRYNKYLVDARLSNDGNAVTAYFDDNTEVIGCTLIGADGVRSIVRRILVGPEKAMPTSTLYEGFMVNASYPAEDAVKFRQFHPMYVSGVHPDGYFFWLSTQDVPDPADPTTWRFISQVSRKVPSGRITNYDATTCRQIVNDIASQCSEPFRSAWLHLPDDTVVWHVKPAYWVPIPWDNAGGRMTLAGDAAHPMTYHRGQGLNHAVNDAWTVVARLKEYACGIKSLADAVSEYNTECRERGGREVLASLRNTELVHSWDDLKESDIFRYAFAKGVQAPTCAMAAKFDASAT